MSCPQLNREMMQLISKNDFVGLETLITDDSGDKSFDKINKAWRLSIKMDNYLAMEYLIRTNPKFDYKRDTKIFFGPNSFVLESYLHYAARFGSKKAGNFLVDAGLEVDRLNSESQTAQQIALKNRHFEFASYLETARPLHAVRDLEIRKAKALRQKEIEDIESMDFEKILGRYSGRADKMID